MYFESNYYYKFIIILSSDLKSIVIEKTYILFSTINLQNFLILNYINIFFSHNT